MNIIIAGDGKVGSTLAGYLSAEGHNLTVIDHNPQALELTQTSLDVMTVQGNCASMHTLMEAGAEKADLLIAATGTDEVNLLCCTTAYGLNPKIHTIARIRNPEYAEQVAEMRHIFELSMTINPERKAAVEIERLLQYPGFLKRDTFAKGKVEIVELRLDGDSKLCGLPLTALNTVVKCKVLLCAVLRDGVAIVPKGDFVLQEGDRIFVTAPTENLTTLLKNLNIITRPVKRVILCGGGTVSYYLAALLEKDGISVQIIEQDPERCRHLAESLPNASVICGDGTDQSLLAAEGLAKCDALVTLTGMDELNMIVSLYGQNQGVPQVITKLSRIENQHIIDSLALGSVVCPKELSCNSIVRYVRAMKNQSGAAISVHAIADGQVEAVEFRVNASTLNCGIPLKNLKIREGVLLSCITHGANIEIANGNSVFVKGDTIVAVTGKRGLLQNINDIFA